MKLTCIIGYRKENLQLAQDKKFILEERRTFLEVEPGP